MDNVLAKSHLSIVSVQEDQTLIDITTSRGNIVSFVLDTDPFFDWYLRRQLIQRCFPDMPVENRELLISGMDYEDQKIMFGWEEQE
jgi:hypothetical protein